MIRDVVNRVFTFQSTPSVWRETNVVRVKLHSTAISIHSLRVEGDTWFYGNEVRDYDFNPLPPCGGRRVEDSAADSCIYISIHSLRVEGDCGTIDDNGVTHGISIHSLRVEGDDSAHREGACLL